MGHAKQQTSYPLRISEELKTWLKARAEANLRSVNAEIVAILLQAREAEKEASHRPAE